MRKALWVAIGVLSVATIAIAIAIDRWTGAPNAGFVTATVATGDMVRAITTTGSVNPVVTVQVGTYVSGPIQKIACDFNTEVEAGQLCAKIDPRTFQEEVDQARADLGTSQAQLHKDQASLEYARINYQRDQGLRASGVVSQDTLDSDHSAWAQAVSQVELDRSTIEQKGAALRSAQTSLDYTNIVSPVKGTVVSRNVDVGQTVAASFQTPTLFLIAQDLTKMQVDTNVSESDVGLAEVGQRATFTVEAFPHETFEGRVAQVRRAPITVQNVVTYDVVIGVDNPDRKLIPGMTANAHIIVEERKDVKSVPARALRFDPGGARAAPQSAASGSQERRVWVLRDGRPAPVPVSTGLDDGTNVEIKDGALAVGDRVVVAGSDHGGARAGPTSPFRF